MLADRPDRDGSCRPVTTVALCIAKYMSDTTAEISENAALFLRSDRPSTLIRHENALQSGGI